MQIVWTLSKKTHLIVIGLGLFWCNWYKAICLTLFGGICWFLNYLVISPREHPLLSAFLFLGLIFAGAMFIEEGLSFNYGRLLWSGGPFWMNYEAKHRVVLLSIAVALTTGEILWVVKVGETFGAH